MLEILKDVLVDTLLDSLKILPFLFISYLIIEFIEHKSSEKLEKALSTSGKYSKIIGSILGIIPQCGFSAVAANLFSNRVITMGTLIAVFLSTSDEAIPMLISSPDKKGELLLILGIKFIIAVIFGTIIDLIFKDKHTSHEHTEEMHEHMHETCKDCDCEHDGILKSSIKHTLKIFLFLVVISFILGLVVELIGMEDFEKLLLSGSVFQSFVTSIIGLIPNCASSLLITELFLSGTLSFGALFAGLLVNSGLGMMVLLKEHKNFKQTLLILGICFFVAVALGYLTCLVAGF